MRQEEFDLGVAAQPVQHTYGGYTITHDPKAGTGAITHNSAPSDVVDTVGVSKGMVKQALVHWHNTVVKGSVR